MVDEMTLALVTVLDTETGGTTLPLGVPVTEVVVPELVGVLKQCQQCSFNSVMPGNLPNRGGGGGASGSAGAGRRSSASSGSGSARGGGGGGGLATTAANGEFTRLGQSGTRSAVVARVEDDTVGAISDIRGLDGVCVGRGLASGGAGGLHIGGNELANTQLDFPVSGVGRVVCPDNVEALAGIDSFAGSGLGDGDCLRSRQQGGRSGKGGGNE